MDIHLSPADGVPVYLQIINQVKQLIASGRLLPDCEIPPIRVLAEQLLINPNTVARAYRELENAGWVYKKRGAGTYVSDRGSPLSLKERRRQIGERISALLTEAHRLQIPIDMLVAMIRQAESQRIGGPSEEEVRDTG